MFNKEQMRDILTAYYTNTDDVQNRANYLRVDPELLAERKAEQAMETTEGVELYNNLIESAKKLYERITNN